MFFVTIFYYYTLYFNGKVTKLLSIPSYFTFFTFLLFYLFSFICTFADDMEQKKSPQADLEQQRTTGFLLGVVLVLTLFFVALEWNNVPSADDMAKYEGPVEAGGGSDTDNQSLNDLSPEKDLVNANYEQPQESKFDIDLSDLSRQVDYLNDDKVEQDTDKVDAGLSAGFM